MTIKTTLWRTKPAMTKVLVLLSLIITIPAFATDPDPAAQKTVASKAYVDTKQDKIPAGTYGANNSVVTYDSTTGDVQERWIYGAGLEYYGDFMDSILRDALSANLLSMLVEEELDNGHELTLNEIENSIPKIKWVAAAIGGKQNKIFRTSNGTNNTPNYVYDSSTNPTADGSVVTTTGTTGLTEQRGIATAPTYDSSNNLTNGSWLPTMSALMNQISSATDTLTWDSAETTSTNAYETKFVGDTGATAQSWPAIDKDKLVDGSALANALALKQNKLPARFTSETNTTQMRAMGGETIELAGASGYVYHRYITAGGNEPLTIRSGADNTILYVNGTKTVEQFQTSNFGGTGNTATTNQNYIKNALVSLELLKDVYSELNSKITNNALPTGTTGTVVTYNGTNQQTGVQQFTETAMTGTVTYTNGTLDNANDIATITAVGTRQKKKECGGYEPAAAGQPAHDGTHPGDEDYCWLWIFPDD